MRVTSSRDLAIVIEGPAIVIAWPTKKHKVVYVLVIGLHHSHCVARLSHWAAHHSHWVAHHSHWVAHHVHWVARHRHGVPTEVLGKYIIVDVTFRLLCQL
jgi:hypothetical protein